ncbi:MAG: hypothetical protein II393_04115 [Cytophagales bacterium]|nr:hypothetical protein [Cytophagales bacterium]
MAKLEYYVYQPSLKQIYGKKVDKNTEFTEKTEDGRVEQSFKKLTLTTHVKSKTKQGKFEIEEDSTMKIKVPSGTILLWDENNGFVIPQYVPTTLEDLKKEIEDIQEIYNGGGDNEAKGNERKDV